MHLQMGTARAFLSFGVVHVHVSGVLFLILSISINTAYMASTTTRDSCQNNPLPDEKLCHKIHIAK